MYLLRVIPIKKGIPKDILCYFTSKNYDKGSIIDIPIRKGKSPALVLDSEILETGKAEVKSLPFALRKLGETTSSMLLSPTFIEAIQEISDYHACQIGSALDATTPKALFTERESLLTKSDLRKSPSPSSTGKILAFQADDEARLAHYKSLIRESFAYKRSILIIVPTIKEGENLFNHLRKGISDHAFLLHGGVAKSQFIKAWNEIACGTHPLLVVATPIFFALPREWHTVIIERESSRHYKMVSRPFIDMRNLAEVFCRKAGSLCILSDNLLRIETLHRLEKFEIEGLSQTKWRSLTSGEIELVDMRSYNKEKKDFRLLSNELQSLIMRTKSESSHIFLYTARRGLSPQTVCKDCGTTVICNRCKAPVVLHSLMHKDRKEIRYFLCHRCGEKRDALEVCRHCRSWNLIPLGIGTEGVHEYLQTNFPDIPVFRIDSDTATTEKQINSLVESFYNTPGAIALGTDRALLSLHEKVEYAAVVSLDGLFALPDFRIHEKIFHTILHLRQLVNHSLLIQTREADNPIWEEAVKGNLELFYKRELKERELLKYPPWHTLIKITYSGHPESVRREMQNLKHYLSPYEASIFPAFIENADGKFSMHALLRVEKGKWPQVDLLQKLRSLPPTYSVNVDPENLL